MEYLGHIKTDTYSTDGVPRAMLRQIENLSTDVKCKNAQ